MREQSQSPDLQEREPVAEKEYQRVAISGEEKCGVCESNSKVELENWKGQYFMIEALCGLSQ